MEAGVAHTIKATGHARGGVVGGGNDAMQDVATSKRALNDICDRFT